MRIALALALTVLTACSAKKLGPPTTKPLPEPSTRTALRGGGPARSPRLASYRIEARLDAESRTISAIQILRWKNGGTVPVTSLPFHLYMNAFKNETSIFMEESRGQHRSARASETGWGLISVSSIKLHTEGSEASELRPGAKFGVDETTLEVPLPRAVAPGQEIVLEMAFQTELPEVFARTGYKGEFLMVGQWFPKIGVLVGDKWHCEPFHLNSEFFADFGNYDVTLTVPDTHVVAATGVLTAARATDGGMRALTYHAEDVHDFVWMADPYMETLHTTADAGDGGEPVDIYVLYRPAQLAYARRHLEAAKQAVEIFSRRIYPYPWPSMTIVDPPPDAADGAGGMEYPMLVTTAADYPFFATVLLPEFVTVHEVGHNWFQGLLASNEVREAWLDEGINEYADGIVMEEWRGEERALGHIFGSGLRYYEFEQMRANWDELAVPIDTVSYEFPTNDEYGLSTYSRTAIALKTLENVVGKDKFFAALSGYAHEYAFKHPTAQQFFDFMSAKLGEDARRFLDPAFRGNGAVDFRVGELRVRRYHEPRGRFGDMGETTRTKTDAPLTDEWLSSVLVMNVGAMGVPVEVEMRFDDGSTRREMWTPTPQSWRWKRFELRAPRPVVGVTIDPDDKVLYEWERLQNAERSDESSDASWRAAARGGFWQQTLLQLVGL